MCPRFFDFEEAFFFVPVFFFELADVLLLDFLAVEDCLPDGFAVVFSGACCSEF